jgi:hypothetical protein
LFCYQQWQLTNWRTQWAAISAKVTELEQITQKINQFRPWFDESVRGLTILKQLTLAFPEEGTVSAKTVEIRDLNQVSCSGIALDNQALRRTVEKLSATRGVTELHRSQTRGKAPIQFTFDYHWSKEANNEN